MVELLIRGFRIGEVLPSLADALEWGRRLRRVDAKAFRVPDAEGLVESFEEQLRAEHDADVLRLVAERQGQLVGYVQGPGVATITGRDPTDHGRRIRKAVRRSMPSW